MNTPVNPQTMHGPLGLYSHTINVDAGSRWLAMFSTIGRSVPAASGREMT